jgi:hypothetical protein
MVSFAGILRVEFLLSKDISLTPNLKPGELGYPLSDVLVKTCLAWVGLPAARLLLT